LLGQKPVEDPYITIGLLATIFYMLFLVVIIPCIEYYENLQFNIITQKNSTYFLASLSKIQSLIVLSLTKYSEIFGEKRVRELFKEQNSAVFLSLMLFVIFFIYLLEALI